MKVKFKKILLKISGEALMGDTQFGIDHSSLSYIAKEIKSVVDLGVQLSIVIGGGNIFRGAKNDFLELDRTSKDHMGMLATTFNGLALQGMLEKIGVETRVQTALPMHGIAEPYILKRAIAHLEKNRVVIFTAGLGCPYFTTDTAAVLRAKETKSYILLKATNVDALYDSDPKFNVLAKPIKSIKYMDVILRQLKVMDITAISLAMDNHLPIAIFSIKEKNNIKKIICGYTIGTFINN